jgi:Nucleotidyl transferase AbiEii toxin, Type IV TA system
MALTPIQRRVCRLLADRRRASGESYVAGGVALNVALGTFRVSRDLDVFHDTAEAVARSADQDRALLRHSGYDVVVVRDQPGFVECVATAEGESLVIEWARDSAFRFFPLVAHEDLGLTLHPFDLATNKVLALVGRLEVRDWIDLVACDERLQPLGYLAWAASGKDPGFTPQGILDLAGRSSHYSADEVAALSFAGPTPDAAALSRHWHAALAAAAVVVARLPRAHVGQAVLTAQGDLFRGNLADLNLALETRAVVFHPGRIGGALPRVAPAAD